MRHGSGNVRGRETKRTWRENGEIRTFRIPSLVRAGVVGVSRGPVKIRDGGGALPRGGFPGDGKVGSGGAFENGTLMSPR